MATIKIPSPLRKLTDNQAEVSASGANIQEVLGDLANQFPKLAKNLLDGEGRLRSFVRLYLGDEDIAYLQKEDTAVQDDSVVSIIPAIAGGIN